MRAKKIVNQSSDFPVCRTGSYRHKKALVMTQCLCVCLSVCLVQGCLRHGATQGVPVVSELAIIQRQQPVCTQWVTHSCWLTWSLSVLVA